MLKKLVVRLIRAFMAAFGRPLIEWHPHGNDANVRCDQLANSGIQVVRIVAVVQGAPMPVVNDRDTPVWFLRVEDERGTRVRDVGASGLRFAYNGHDLLDAVEIL
jgi:Tfp pilus assembly protein FimT